MRKRQVPSRVAGLRKSEITVTGNFILKEKRCFSKICKRVH
jgi:hypothetical protein